MSGSTYCPSAHGESEKRCIKMPGFQHIVPAPIESDKKMSGFQHIVPAHIERDKKCQVSNILSVKPPQRAGKNVRF